MFSNLTAPASLVSPLVCEAVKLTLSCCCDRLCLRLAAQIPRKMGPGAAFLALEKEADMISQPKKKDT